MLPVALPEVADPARPLEARLTLRVAEGSGRPVERAGDPGRCTPSAPMIGVKPLFDGVVAEGQRGAVPADRRRARRNAGRRCR